MRSSNKCHWYIMTILLASMKWIIITESAATSSSSSTSINSTLITQSDNRTQPLTTSRRKRFVRFPSSNNYIFDQSGPPTIGQITSRNLGYQVPRFPPLQQSIWRQQKSYWRPSIELSRPVMAHRSPRLIFRDDFPTFPASGVGSSFFQTNQLGPDIDEEFRGKLFTYFIFSVYIYSYFINCILVSFIIVINFIWFYWVCLDHRKQIFNEYPKLETGTI